MITTTEITFRDLKEREEVGRARLDRRIAQLELLANPKDPSAPKDPAAAKRLNELKKLKTGKRFDALVEAVRLDVFATAPPVIRDGRIDDPTGGPRNPTNARELELFAVTGLLLADGVAGEDPERAPELRQDLRFNRALARARGEYKTNKELFERVYDVLGDETSVTDKAGTTTSLLQSEDLARVVRELAGRGVSVDDGYLPVYARTAFGAVTGGDSAGPPSAIDINLPDLEAEVDIEIVQDNLHAMQAIYFAATLEELKLFQVMDRLVELFHQGMLPLGKGNAGNQLYGYWKKSTDRFTEVERRNLYSRAFGFPGGDSTTGSPNREFLDLWLRFLSAVSDYYRQLTVDQLLVRRNPVSLSQEQVRKAGRDLAANLSLYGYGVAYFAATEIQTQLRDILEVLGDEEVRSAYGARDVWQVVDQVATLELGGARNGVRYRTMATAGAIIIRWLASNAERLTSLGRSSFLDPYPNGFDPSHKAMVDPTDQDLVDACEQWLAVTGTPEGRVEEYSQPVEGPNQTSRPIQIPSVARDLLDSVGVGSAPLNPN